MIFGTPSREGTPLTGCSGWILASSLGCCSFSCALCDAACGALTAKNMMRSTTPTFKTRRLLQTGFRMGTTVSPLMCASRPSLCFKQPQLNSFCFYECASLCFEIRQPVVTVHQCLEGSRNPQTGTLVPPSSSSAVLQCSTSLVKVAVWL